MNLLKYSLLLICLFTYVYGFAQKDLSVLIDNYPLVRQLTIEPGIGIHTNFGTDILVTNLIQWNPYKRFSVASHTSFNINNVSQRDFNGIKTEFNFSINQKFGIGTSLYSKRSVHTFLLMVGAKYTTFRETLGEEDFNKVSTTISTLSPDYGLMYSLKKGWKNCFFTFRMYLPLYPWPVKGSSIFYLDDNLNNIALEFGVGIKIK